MNSANKLGKLRYKLHAALNYSREELLRISDEQLGYISHAIKRASSLEACPGSGKTEVIGLKAALEIHRWKDFNSGIAVVTFTKSAAKELSLRVRKYGNVSTELFPHFIGTFDSWLSNYILQPFTHYLTRYSGKDGDKSIRMIDTDSSAGFLANYSANIWRDPRNQPIEVTEYYFNPDFTEIAGIDDKADSLLRGITAAEFATLKRKKKAFITAGFATYADAEMLCRILVRKYSVLAERIAKRFPVIVVDECQDLSLGQLDLLESLRVKGTALHFVGDLNQSIYEFRKVDPRDTENYIRDKGFVKLRLTNNYRSCQPIVNVCENILGNPAPITGRHIQHCVTPCQLWEYEDGTYQGLPGRFVAALAENNILTKHAVILARGKATLRPFRHQHTASGLSKVEMAALAFHNWYKPHRTSEELQNALAYTGKVLCFLGCDGNGDSRNQFCPEGMPNVAWRLFLKSFLENGSALYPFNESGRDLTWSKWANKFKRHLAGVWGTLKGMEMPWTAVSAKVRAPNGKGSEAVNNTCSSATQRNLFRTTTIHAVKGETVEAVLLISSQNRKTDGGFYGQWLKEGSYDPEHIRFAYVACSRARSLLVIATPTLSAADKQKLLDWGLTFV